MNYSHKTLPVISVIMPLYKETPTVLKRTINSILSQTFNEIELIVIIDNPTHFEAINLIQQYSKDDDRLIYFINKKNMGVWASYNIGIGMVKGKYIAIQDADDFSNPDRLKILYDFLSNHPEIDIVGSSLIYVNERQGKILLTRRYPSLIDSIINKYSPMAHGTTLRKANLHEKYGFYDESDQFKCTADYELWCRWYIQGVRMYNIPDILYIYYQYISNIKNQNTIRTLKETIAIKRRYMNQLNFTVIDKIILHIENIISHFSPKLIIILFYISNRILSRITFKKSLTSILS